MAGGRGSRGTIVGRRYGRWLVLRESDDSARYGPGAVRRVVAQCDCGTVRDIPVSGLYSGRSKSCGCLHKEIVSGRANPDRVLALAKRKLKQYKAQAGRAGREFAVSLDELVAYSVADCFYCGAKATDNPLVDKRRAGNNSMLGGLHGMDRVDNNGGYTKDNIVPCCPACNYSKRDRTTDEFLAWASRVANHNRVE